MMSDYSLVELSRIVRELREQIAAESAELSHMYLNELDQRLDDSVSDETLEKSRALNEKIERCMTLWQELKTRTANNK